MARITSSALRVARNIAPLIMKTQPVPTREISPPATAGPMRRAILKHIELSPTALGSERGGTSSEMKVRRGGPSKAATTPSKSAKIETLTTLAAPVRTRAPKPKARTIIPSWVRKTILRLSKRSARAPATGMIKRTGRN